MYLLLRLARALASTEVAGAALVAGVSRAAELLGPNPGVPALSTAEIEGLQQYVARLRRYWKATTSIYSVVKDSSFKPPAAACEAAKVRLASIGYCTRVLLEVGHPTSTRQHGSDTG